ncbi:MAG: AraC family transcriptional regulator [Eubacteriales bacterium]|nr:AraC family transcriptional regulator [Eubacteriales bacterium]
MRQTTQRFDPRQSMHRSTFEIFHYKSPRQGNVAIHHHDFYEVYFFIGGTVEYRVEGRVYQLAPGDLLLISPMELHQAFVVQDSAPYERIVLWIDRAYLESFCTPEADLTRCFDYTLPSRTNLLRLTPAQRSDIGRRLEELVRESYSEEFGAQIGALGLFLQFMTELNRIFLHSCAKGAGDEESLPLVSRVLGYIGEHYNEELSLDGLAREFYISKYHLSHEFRRVVGTSVHKYILLKRLLIAKQLLSEGGAPGEVYSACGFGDYTSFYRAFRAQYGASPREYAGKAAP